MDRDAEHLNLLALFHFIYAGLTAAFSSLFLFHVSAGIMILNGMFEDKNANTPEEIGWLFVLMGGLAVLIGWLLAGLIVAGGVKLRQRRGWLFCMIMAGLMCMMAPLGTVLGVFTIIVLLRDRVRDLFASRAVTMSPEVSR
ncbi:MAG: hypothetical protein EA378_03295 [Phycisphaerales bacterium]|nr:MAG: hypothetical protein EA378_03295 [Phycisphaerales bacterium]